MKVHLKSIGAILALTAIVLMPSLATAAIINVDFGLNTQTTPGNWNNMGGAVGPGDFGDSGATPFTLAGLIDDTGAATGISLTMAAVWRRPEDPRL